MPFAFPSHQGLIAPLWRRWPKKFDALSLCIGAAVPDIIDGLIGTWRGGLGQSYGHSLIGLFLLCWPLTIVLTLASAPLAKRWMPWRPPWRIFLISAWIGPFSHIAIDFVSHANCKLLLPWYNNPHVFPSWWYIKWGSIPLPLYRDPYPFSPHLIVWLILGIVGAIMFFWPWIHRDAKPRMNANEHE